ncbi:hypothetical protein K1719_011429 [Acacia pycnantha]|nr:hypothetical protein K1719_011429 [Acacia pycnantha]
MAHRKICGVDDRCFECKDVQDLRDLLVCDHEDCGKVYHWDCAWGDYGPFEYDQTWICDRHYCFSCREPSKFDCLGCPFAVCKECYSGRKYAVRGGKVLCCRCLELVFIIENNLDHDSKGNKINLNDRETVEAQFKEYWDIIKLKEGLTGDDVCATLNKYKMDRNSLHHRRLGDPDQEDEDEDSEDGDDEEEEDDRNSHHPSEEEEEDYITYDTDNHKLGPKSNRSKSKEFIGWKPNFAPTKYKKVKTSLHQREFGERDRTNVCDDENIGSFTYKLPNDQPSLLMKSLLKKGDYISRISCFASINAENIELIYLKQSLVIELSEQPESFEDKVVGTFVKIQGDPTDHRQGNHCHLVRVIVALIDVGLLGMLSHSVHLKPDIESCKYFLQIEVEASVSDLQRCPYH